MINFDEHYWAEVIKRPDWYLEFLSYYRPAEAKLGKESEAADEFRKTVRLFFEKALQEDRVALAEHGPNLDEQRQPIDTIVIHHTSAKPGYQLPYMNATQLLNIYAVAYANPSARQERGLQTRAIWSGHFREGKMSFLGYHWLLRMDPVRSKNYNSADSPANRTSNGMDGSFERLLDDDQIGWHSGDWQTNRRSIGICLDNDYEKQDPTKETLTKLADHIKKHYPQINDIIGHCEVRKTTCPGGNFLDTWKSKLLKAIAD